jgi:two-component system response regulator FixJ
MTATRIESQELDNKEASIENSTVFIIDDEEQVRESISFEMDSVGYKVRTYAAAQDFLDDYEPSMAGCLILDVRMQKMSGLELQRVLNERGITIPVIVISGHADVLMAVRAMKAKAMDFLQKPVSGQVLLELVNKALIKDARQREKSNRGDDVVKRLATLTRRELEVLDHVVDGQISTEIAIKLDVNYKTIEAHRAKINRKMNAKNVAQLISLVNGARPSESTQ